MWLVHRSRLVFSCLFLVIMFFASSAFCQQSQGTFIEGKELFQAGKYNASYDKFLEAFKQDPSNLDISFYLGRAAFEKGDYEAAIMAFERILMMDPDALRVKLELARSHFKLGAYETAKQYFNEVLAKNPPAAVKKKIDMFLAAIHKAEKKHFINGMVSLGASLDDNVRTAPVSDIVQIGEFPITLQGVTPQDDHIQNTTFMLNHSYKFEDGIYSWNSTGIFYNAAYGSETDLDINYFSLSSGPVLQTNKYKWNVYNLSYSRVYLDDDEYTAIFGVGSSIMFPVNPKMLFKLNYKREDRNYAQDAGKDSINENYSGGPILTVGPNSFSLDFSSETEDAEDFEDSYDRRKWSLRYDRKLPMNITMIGRLSYEDTDYRGISALFNEKRSDTINKVSLGVSKPLWIWPDKAQSLSASLIYDYTDSVSNISLYTYRKNVTSFTLAMTF